MRSSVGERPGRYGDGVFNGIVMVINEFREYRAEKERT